MGHTTVLSTRSTRLGAASPALSSSRRRLARSPPTRNACCLRSPSRLRPPPHTTPRATARRRRRPLAQLVRTLHTTQPASSRCGWRRCAQGGPTSHRIPRRLGGRSCGAPRMPRRPAAGCSPSPRAATSMSAAEWARWQSQTRRHDWSSSCTDCACVGRSWPLRSPCAAHYAAYRYSTSIKTYKNLSRHRVSSRAGANGGPSASSGRHELTGEWQGHRTSFCVHNTHIFLTLTANYVQ